jgi:branched-chain amino acid transport system substrate-binding protein
MIMRLLLAICFCLGFAQPGIGQISDDAVRIGVLTDMNGIFAAASGPGSVLAAQMAAEDFGGKVRGKPIEIISADHQNKPDVGTAIIRKWFDTESVDAVTDLPLSSIALAAQEIARQKKKTLLISGGATSDLYGKACSPYSTLWSDDTYTLAATTAKAILDNGGKEWFFVTVDYALGHALERDATSIINANGGKVLGAVRHPLGQPDLASFLLQAQSSKSKVIGLANVGSDTSNTLKQAKEFGISQGGQSVVAFLYFLTDVHAVGLDVAQGLYLLDGFYWDQNKEARDWAVRFQARHKGAMPTKEHAATYSAVMHYLKAVDLSGTDASEQANAAMRTLEVNHFGHKGSIRVDGRVLFDETLYQVKSPAESKASWDYLKRVRVISRDVAFRPLEQGGCPLAN